VRCSNGFGFCGVSLPGRHEPLQDGVGQPLPGLLVQTQVGFALVAGDDLQMISGELPVVDQQLRIAAVEGLVETAPRCLVVLGSHQADQRAVHQVHPPQPFQGEVTPEETGRPAQQDCPLFSSALGRDDLASANEGDEEREA
jgi:hypothetical protein